LDVFGIGEFGFLMSTVIIWCETKKILIASLFASFDMQLIWHETQTGVFGVLILCSSICCPR
jgi:hypothetical protein